MTRFIKIYCCARNLLPTTKLPLIQKKIGIWEQIISPITTHVASLHVKLLFVYIIIQSSSFGNITNHPLLLKLICLSSMKLIILLPRFGSMIIGYSNRNNWRINPLIYIYCLQDYQSDRGTNRLPLIVPCMYSTLTCRLLGLLQYGTEGVSHLPTCLVHLII